MLTDLENAKLVLDCQRKVGSMFSVKKKKKERKRYEKNTKKSYA